MGRDRRTQRKLQATRNTTQVKNKPAGFFDGLPFFEPLDSLPDEGFYRGNAVFRWSTLKFMAQCRPAFVMDAVHDGGIEKLLGCNCKFLVAMTKNALSTASVTEFQCIEFECFLRMRGTGHGFKIWRRCQKRNPPLRNERLSVCIDARASHKSFLVSLLLSSNTTSASSQKRKVDPGDRCQVDSSRLPSLPASASAGPSDGRQAHQHWVLHL